MGSKAFSSIIDYHKDDELRRRINAFLKESFDLPEMDYYARLDISNLIKLKSTLSDIHNSLTMQLTFGFLKWAEKALSLTAEETEEIRRVINGTKPNTNGYDIKCDAFVAEVKCNIPVNGGRIYGAAQRQGIVKDIKALLEGKTKDPVIHPALKFMVFLDLEEVREANEHLKKSTKQFPDAFQFLQDNEIPTNPDVVYGVYIKLGA